MKYPRYEKYKDSGVEWLGIIPVQWEIKKLKYSVSLINEKSSDEEGNYRYIGLENIASWKGKVFEDAHDYIPEGSSSNRFYKGNVLFGKLRPYLAKAFLSEFDGICTSELLILETTGMDKKFLLYLILSDGFIKIVDSSTYGSKMPRANWNYIGNINIPILSSEEQQAIVDFLDRETTRIDALIEKKQKLIDLLKEKRTALITRAVIKGLDPNVKMKDSGIDWLGEVPKHWEVKKLKYLARLKSGTNITSERIEESEAYPVYGGNGLRGFYSEYTHEGEYVLIGRQGALCGNINYASGKFWASEHAVVVSPLYDIQFFWLGELLRIMNLNQYSVSAAQPGLSVENIQRLYIPVPPTNEQEEISLYLKQETENIDCLKDKIDQAITKHQEYRTALISAAVTGKINVTGMH